MAELNCTACEDLRQEVPELVANGFNDAMCASLKNDTGLKASSGNNDCTDLNTLNDCLIGNLEDEVERYDNCDWKTFTKMFANNAWTTLKAIICAICGIWSNIHSLWATIRSFCITKTGNSISLTSNLGTHCTVTDSDTKYDLSISGHTLSLTGSDGSIDNVVVPDDNTTYTLSIDGHKIILTPSSGSPQSVVVPDTDTWLPNTKTQDGYVLKGQGQANKVWKTDADGNPAWRDDDAGEVIEDICALVGASVAPPFVVAGRCPLITPTSDGIYNVGTAPSSKIKFRSESDLNPYTKDRQGIGIHYAQLEVNDCETGECTVYEWVYPKTFEIYVKDGVESGDVLWYATKTDLQATLGMTDYFWRVFTESSWTWRETPMHGGGQNHKFMYITLTTNPNNMGSNYMGLVFAGTSYPNVTKLDDDVRLTDMTNAPRLYTHTCGMN